MTPMTISACVLDAIGDMIFKTLADGRISLRNKAASAMIARIPRPLSDLVARAYWPK